jgi:hypothetical protein
MNPYLSINYIIYAGAISIWHILLINSTEQN